MLNVNLHDYTDMDPQTLGLGDLLGNALKGFKGVQEARFLPGELQRKEQQELGNIEKTNLANALEKQFGQRREEANIGFTEASREHQLMSNAIQKETGLPKAQADLLVQQWNARAKQQEYQHADLVHDEY